jgi:protocatechuate 3,4-dioxygenase beta subunit
MRKFKLSIFSIFFLSIVFGFFSIQPVSADTFTLSGSVKNSSGNAMPNSTVSVNDANSSNTTTDSAGNYSLVIDEGTYNVQVTPPSGSGFASATAVNQNISGNTVLNFVLVPTGTVTLAGRVLDRSNQPLANQTVGIAPSGTNNYVFATTDSTGTYSFSTTAGNYKIQVAGTNSLSSSAPASYSIISSGTLNLTQQSIIMDIPLPVKQVTVHVQDANGVARSNIGLSTNSTSMPSTPIGTVTNATGISSYSSSVGLTTDASGNATMWLFSTPPSGNRYTITATPPSGSTFTTTNLSSVAVANDSTVTLTIHPPVTLSGKVSDRSNQPLANQTVGIAPQGTSTFTNTTCF